MTVSYWQDAGREEELVCDVVVVGGGIVGSYAARLLRAAGRDVVLLEARDIARGATGRNAGMVLLGLADSYAVAIKRWGRETARELWGLTATNRERTRALLAELGVPSEPCGSLILAGDEAEADDLARSATALAEDGFAVAYHPRDPLGRVFVAGLAQPDDLTLDPVRFTGAIAAAATAEGVTILRDSEVFAIEQGAGGAGLTIRSRRATVRCGAALLATNAYSALLHPFFAGLIRPVRAQMLATAPAPRVLTTAVYANRGYEYIRQLADGRILLGGGRAGFREAEIGYVDETTPSLQAFLEGFLRRHFPEVDAPVTHRWSGTMGFTPDGIPLVGRLPDLPGVWFAAGFGGHGLGIGLVSAERAVAGLLHGTGPGVLDAARLAGVRA